MRISWRQLQHLRLNNSHHTNLRSLKQWRHFLFIVVTSQVLTMMVNTTTVAKSNARPALTTVASPNVWLGCLYRMSFPPLELKLAVPTLSPSGPILLGLIMEREVRTLHEAPVYRLPCWIWCPIREVVEVFLLRAGFARSDEDFLALTTSWDDDLFAWANEHSLASKSSLQTDDTTSRTACGPYFTTQLILKEICFWVIVCLGSRSYLITSWYKLTSSEPVVERSVSFCPPPNYLRLIIWGRLFRPYVYHGDRWLGNCTPPLTHNWLTGN